jgi:hypothetical protein
MVLTGHIHDSPSRAARRRARARRAVPRCWPGTRRGARTRPRASPPSTALRPDAAPACRRARRRSPEDHGPPSRGCRTASPTAKRGARSARRSPRPDVTARCSATMQPVPAAPVPMQRADAKPVLRSLAAAAWRRRRARLH